MALHSDLHETRTNAEHSETGDDLRVSYESQKPVCASDVRIPYYEHQLRRSENYQGYLDEIGIPLDEMRALYAELTDYFGVCDYWTFPLPCTGLPGHLQTHYDRNEEAASLLLLGMEYVAAVARNERKTMHNRWESARELIAKLEGRGEEAAIRRDVLSALDAAETQRDSQKVYFIGSASAVKIGIAVRPIDRLKTLQTGHHEKLEIFATCDGGQQQEHAYHKRFAAHRLHGEWFKRCPEIETEIERLVDLSPKAHRGSALRLELHPALAQTRGPA